MIQKMSEQFLSFRKVIENVLHCQGQKYLYEGKYGIDTNMAFELITQLTPACLS